MADVAAHDHASVLHRSPRERASAAAAFVQRSLDERRRVLYVAEAGPPRRVLDELADGGVDVRGRLASGQLEVRAAGDAYLAGGVFDPTATVRLMRGEVESARAGGWHGFGVAGEMAWALEAGVGVDELLDYEHLVDEVFREADATAMCLYDAERFDEATLDQIAGQHPLVVSEPCAAPRARWEHLRIERRADGALAICGEIDLGNAAAFSAAVRREASLHDPVRLDLADLAFIDVSGITAVLQLGARGHRVVLVDAPRVVRTVMELLADPDPSRLRWETR